MVHSCYRQVRGAASETIALIQRLACGSRHTALRAREKISVQLRGEKIQAIMGLDIGLETLASPTRRISIECWCRSRLLQPQGLYDSFFTLEKGCPGKAEIATQAKRADEATCTTQRLGRALRLPLALPDLIHLSISYSVVDCDLPNQTKNTGPQPIPLVPCL